MFFALEFTIYNYKFKACSPWFSPFLGNTSICGVFFVNTNLFTYWWIIATELSHCRHRKSTSAVKLILKIHEFCFFKVPIMIIRHVSERQRYTGRLGNWSTNRPIDSTGHSSVPSSRGIKRVAPDSLVRPGQVGKWNKWSSFLIVAKYLGRLY